MSPRQSHDHGRGAFKMTSPVGPLIPRDREFPVEPICIPTADKHDSDVPTSTSSARRDPKVMTSDTHSLSSIGTDVVSPVEYGSVKTTTVRFHDVFSDNQSLDSSDEIL